MNTIRRIRERLGLTQAALARGLGLSQANIAHYEKGQTMPPDVARRLIGLARERGCALSFDHVYGARELDLPAHSRAHYYESDLFNKEKR